jgi:hypothetical protein
MMSPNAKLQLQMFVAEETFKALLAVVFDHPIAICRHQLGSWTMKSLKRSHVNLHPVTPQVITRK